MVKRAFDELSSADQATLKDFPRDFKTIPLPKVENDSYGKSAEDIAANQAVETERVAALTAQITKCLQEAVAKKEKVIFTIALIAGDVVILDALHKAGVLDKVKIIFIDTYTLFPETISFLHEVEAHYGFKALVYHAKDIATQKIFEETRKADFFDEETGKLVDISGFDKLCKEEPMGRALTENATDCWINGRRRDHGAERSNLHIWEGGKLNPLAFWSFEDCWLYLRNNKVPYHPLHDAGYSSLGDAHSTIPVDVKEWMAYGNERKGRFVGMNNGDGSKKTECGIHNNLPVAKKAKTAGAAAGGAATVKA